MDRHIETIATTAIITSVHNCLIHNFSCLITGNLCMRLFIDNSHVSTYAVYKVKPPNKGQPSLQTFVERLVLEALCETLQTLCF